MPSTELENLVRLGQLKREPPVASEIRGLLRSGEALPPLKPKVVRETREALRMSRQVFAFKLGVNPRTLERWEQGRSKPNDQAAALIWLVRKYPDTLERLESLRLPA